MKQMEKYAELLVRVGINIQNNQILVINSPIETAEFTRLLSVKAYEAGAREVVIRWNDEKATRIKYDMANDEIFDEAPAWITTLCNDYAEQDAAFLSISASDPEIMKGVDPKRMSRANKASSIALAAYRQRMMSNKNVWCVASIPTAAWAKKVFPNATEEVAIEQLWDAIFKSVRVDQADPVAAWQIHQKDLNQRLNFLNTANFKALRYKNALGTDLTVNLVPNHIWYGGGDAAPQGHIFFANMPTEEVFTMPDRFGANGKIYSSIPLNYNGNLIEEFWFEFKDGLVINYGAAKGVDVLKELLDTDEGAKRLGEVALVPYDSPISNQKILFFNTLYDENASCHFALGKAYPVNVKGGTAMDVETLKANGANDSLTHVDFMVGTSDLEITGIHQDGSEVPVFVKGNFIAL